MKTIGQYLDKKISIHTSNTMSRVATDADTELDLDIDNYDLSDLLGLFHMDVGYGETDLARAKRLVLKTHPDNCLLYTSDAADE